MAPLRAAFPVSSVHAAGRLRVLAALCSAALLLLPGTSALRPNIDLEQTALSAEVPLSNGTLGALGAGVVTPKGEDHRLHYVVLPSIMLAIALAVPYALNSKEAAGKEGAEEEEVEEVQQHRSSIQLGTSEIMTVAFECETMESKWRTHIHDKNLAFGSRLIVAATIAVAVERALMIADRNACNIYTNAWVSYVGTFGILGVVLVTAVYCMRHPTDALYWPLMIFYSIAVLWLNLPPFAFNCQELLQVANRCESEDWKLMARKMDCDLQGHTSMQMIIMYLLMLPYLLPRFSYMHLGWAWIFVLFLGLTIFRLKAFREDRFDAEDVSLHVAMLCVTQIVATLRKLSMEKEQRSQFIEDLEEKRVSEKLYHIFQEMVPEHVIKPMLRGEDIAEQVDQVSILFILINDFDHFASRLSPKDLLEFLNKFFSQMDKICEDNKVTKIETVGEEYVCCVGVVPEDIKENRINGHGAILARLFKAAGEILELQDHEVKFKMGVHTGPIVAGVIGKKLPRFRLFGDTINTAARMMQKCRPGELSFGEATKQEVPSSIPIKLRGQVEMKGKGEVTVYILDRPSDTNVPEKQAPARGRVSKRASTLELLNPGAGAQRTADPTEEQLKEVEQAPGAFDEVLEDVLGGLQGGKKSWILSEKHGFTAESEDKFQVWFHRYVLATPMFCTCLSIQTAALALVTLLEVLHMDAIRIWTKPAGLFFSSEQRIHIFLLSRIIIFALLVFWRATIRTKRMLDNPRIVQWALLCTCCLVAFLLFVSYDALMVRGLSLEYFELSKENQAPFNQQFSLVFVLFFFMVTSVVPLHFAPSTVYVPLAAVLMICRNYTCIYMSQMGRVLFVLTSTLTVLLAHEMEQASRHRFKAKQNIAEMKDRIEGILNTLMPPLLVKELRARPAGSLSLPSHLYKAATIAQSDLCGFTQLASTRTPHEVVKFMDQLFGRFDALTELRFEDIARGRSLTTRMDNVAGKRGVYKVETIGDAYIAGHAECPLTGKNSPVTVLLFGLDMIRATAEWAAELGVNVRCRVGIHHGECVGGIVGTGMMRYHLFGKFMHVLDTLEATSEEAVAQVSSACKAAVEKELRETGRTAEEVFGAFEPREQENLKTSKGEVHEFEEVGGKTFLVRLKAVAA